MAVLTTKNAAPQTITSARAVSKLDPTIKVRNTPITNFGAVARAEGQGPSTGMPTSLTLVLDNSAGVAAKLYRIGDPDSWILPAAGFTGAVDADRTNGIPALAFGKAMAQAPMTVQAINYRSTSGAVQFAETFMYITADVDGSSTTKPVNVSQYQRNTAQDPNLMTLEFDNQFTLDWNRAFVISAGIGQLVSVTLMFGAAGYR